jgi:hypothetical protein
MMKKSFVLVAAGIALLGICFGQAADLEVRGGTIQEGSDSVGTDHDGVYVTGWDLNPITGLVDGVDIGDIDGWEEGNLDCCVILTRGGFELVRGWYDNVDSSQVTVTLDYPMAAFLIGEIHVYLATGGYE